METVKLLGQLPIFYLFIFLLGRSDAKFIVKVISDGHEIRIFILLTGWVF